MTVIFIECGTATASPFNTGIQRVVRNIIRESQEAGRTLGHECVLVRFADSQFHVIELPRRSNPDPPVNRAIHLVAVFAILADKWLKRLLPSRPYHMIRGRVAPFIRNLHRKFLQGRLGPTANEVVAEQISNRKTEDVAVAPVLLLLDSTWDLNMWSAVDKFRASGGKVCAVLYDLIPFTHPQTVEEHTRNAHTFWWTKAPLHLDAVMCISQTVRAEFLQWQGKQELSRRLAEHQVGYFYLGSELVLNNDDAQLTSILLKNEPYFLVVGSIEPRKNHELILDAFELLWQKGETPNLVIVGGHGWKSEAFFSRLHAHPLYKKKIFFLNRTTDAELTLLYRKTAALITASVAEGFGLPIVEAFQHGTKVICSDIPVFREIALDRAVFFSVSSSEDLARRVIENLKLILPLQIADPMTATKWLTWQQSAAQLFNELFTCLETPR